MSLTSPTNFLVMQPMVQLNGFSPEPLASLSYELTNSTGLTTNGQVLILRQFYDTKMAGFTTNYFQAFDIDLALGTNLITLRATDEAGNVTVTNFTFKLDYTGKTNATVQVAWPAAGMAVSGSNFTLYGFVDDPTVAVQAFITDTNGTTNVVSGMVERTGRFWVDDLPLNGGTNKVSIVISNAIGQLTVTNFNVTQSALNLTLDDLTDNPQLWQPTVSLHGTVSDPAATVTVNGITAVNNGDGSWNAEGVPTTAGGVAIFTASASGAGGPNGNTISGPEKPARVYVSEDHLSDNSYGYDAVVPDVGDFQGLWNNYHYDVCDVATHNNQSGSGGANHVFAFPPNGSYLSADYQFSYPDIDQPGTSVWLNPPNWIQPWQTTNQLVARPTIWRHVAAGWQLTANDFFISEANWDADATANYHNNMGADTVIHLQTGGRSGSKRQNLFCLSGSATAYKTWPWPYFEPMLTPDDMPGIPDHAVPFGQITMNGLGLGSDGNRWVVLPDDQDLDITPKVKGNDFFTFTAGAGKYKLVIQDNGTELDPDVANKTNCVGESVNFTLGWSPARPPIVSSNNPEWTLGGQFVNTNLPKVFPDASTDYINDPALLKFESTHGWWVDGKSDPVTLTAEFKEDVTLDNGQTFSLNTSGKFGMFKPKVKWTGTKHGSVAVDTIWEHAGGKTCLHFGFYNYSQFPNTVGVSFEKEIINDGGFSGIYSPVQLIDRESLACGSNGISGHYIGVGLDAGPLPTLNGIDFWDDPGMDCDDANYHVEVKHCRFQTFLMFKPSDGISVPLKLIEWNWFGAANKNPVWIKTSGDGAVTVSDQDTTTFPAWTNVVNGLANTGFIHYTNSLCQ